MLNELHIENIAVIERADINFGPGLNILTGETGAGKSIVIDAISAVLGERTSRELIRTGAKSALVSAVFVGLPRMQWLEEHGFDGSFARAGNAFAGISEPGIGGTWQLQFMIWNEIRSDCWFPIFQYTDHKGKVRTSSCPYGAFRDDYKVGDRVELGFTLKRPWDVFPHEGDWLRKKAIIYGIMAAVMIVVGTVMVFQFYPYLK